MKKTKLNGVYDAANVLNFYDFKRITKSKTNKHYKNKTGFLFWLDKLLTVEQKQQLNNKYNNLLFFVSVSQYAPELKKSLIFVSDTVIKEV